MKRIYGISTKKAITKYHCHLSGEASVDMFVTFVPLKYLSISYGNVSLFCIFVSVASKNIINNKNNKNIFF